MSGIADACDQNDIDVPYYGDAPKDWKDAERLKTKWGAVMFHGGSVGPGPAMYLFPLDQRTSKGGNFWVTAFTASLNMERTRRNGKLPPKLYLQCDNGSEFKNYCWFQYCEYLVKTGVFKVLKLCFLTVGHTHEDIDACFGRLAQAFRKIRVVKDLRQAQALATQANSFLKSIHWVTVG
jgi:hypothetical protein